MNRKVFVLSLLMALLLCGCQKKNNQEEETAALIQVGFSQLGNESDWRDANTESMKATFTEDAGFELQSENAQQKQDNQLAAIRNFILKEMDYIVFAPLVENGWEEVLTEAKDAGIPVIIMDRQVDTEDDTLYTAWVGSDMETEGRKATFWLDGELKARGKEKDRINIVHIQGTLGSSAQLGRSKALEAAIESHANWNLSYQEDGEFTTAKAYELMTSLLKKTRDIDVIYCENDNEAFGVIKALDEAGLSYGADGDIILISFDATQAGLTYTMEGKINLDVECQPLLGEAVKEIIIQLENGEIPQKKSYIEESAFTREDLTEDFIASRGY